MFKVTLSTVLLVLLALALRHKHSGPAIAAGACILALCLPRAQAQTNQESELREHDSRFGLGVNLSGLIGSSTGGSGNAGVGVRSTFYSPDHIFALDAEVNHFFISTPSSFARGGNLTQVLIGPKMNVMIHEYDERLGPFTHFFFKVRPGFVSWSNGVIGLGLAPPISPGGTQAIVPRRLGRATMPALDLGISLEAPLGKGFAWHVDVGDTFVYAPEFKVPGTAIKVSGGAKSNFQVSTGVFYRFWSRDQKKTKKTRSGPVSPTVL